MKGGMKYRNKGSTKYNKGRPLGKPSSKVKYADHGKAKVRGGRKKHK